MLLSKFKSGLKIALRLFARRLQGILLSSQHRPLQHEGSLNPEPSLRILINTMINLCTQMTHCHTFKLFKVETLNPPHELHRADPHVVT